MLYFSQDIKKREEKSIKQPFSAPKRPIFHVKDEPNTFKYVIFVEYR